MESLTLPSPDVEVLIKQIIELRTEEMWWIELSKLLVEDERHKCNPAAWPCVNRHAYENARASLFWLKLMSER